METVKVNSTVRLYDTPAVVYEATLVAHAGTTTLPEGGCKMSTGDVLDIFSGQ
jgi:hypothetical protein